MKKWTQLAVIAAAAIALTAAPALAGNRGRGHQQHGSVHRGGGGWSTSSHVWHRGGHAPAYHVPVYHTPVYHTPVYHPPIYVPSYRSRYQHGWHGQHSIHSGGVGIHAGGLGIHIRF